MSEKNTENNNEKRICYRHKQTDIFLLPSGKQLRVVAEMKDSIHHLCVNMVVNHPSLRIRSITCDMISVPNALCRQAINCFEQLIGRRVLSGILAGNQKNPSIGCTHLTNLLYDACYNLFMAQGRILRNQLNEFFPEITEAQIIKFALMFRPELLDSCVRYSKTSPFIETVNNSSLPENANRFVALVRS